MTPQGPFTLYCLSLRIARCLVYDLDEFHTSSAIPLGLAKDIVSTLSEWDIARNKKSGFEYLLRRHVFRLQDSESDFYIGDRKYRHVSFEIRRERRHFQFQTICYGTHGILRYKHAERQDQLLPPEWFHPASWHLEGHYWRLILYYPETPEYPAMKSFPENDYYPSEDECHEKNHVPDPERDNAIGLRLFYY
jgi:hypothetical protein